MFATQRGFMHRRITPEWPKANDEAERLMKTLEKAIRTAVIQGKNWKQELFTFLRQYRATPHSTTEKSPSELLNRRKRNASLLYLGCSTMKLPQRSDKLMLQERRRCSAVARGGAGGACPQFFSNVCQNARNAANLIQLLVLSPFSEQRT